MPVSVSASGTLAGQLLPARDRPLELGAGLGDRALVGRGHGLVIYRISPGLQAPRPAAAHASRPLDRPSRGADRGCAAADRTGELPRRPGLPGSAARGVRTLAARHTPASTGSAPSAALEVAGVEAVLTAPTSPTCRSSTCCRSRGSSRRRSRRSPRERARFAGEAVAIVLADSRYEAEDGAELVEVEYEPLPHVVDAEAARPETLRCSSPSSARTSCTEDSHDRRPEAAFAEAAHVSRGRLPGNRYVAVPLEPRGCAAEYEPSTGELTFWSSTQSPHLLRRRLAMATGIGEARIRVITPDVGGGFGQKIPIHPEELAVALAARATGRAVVWLEDRRENLIAAPHAKEQLIESELALGPDGEFLGAADANRRRCRRVLLQQRERPDRAVPVGRCSCRASTGCATSTTRSWPS